MRKHFWPAVLVVSVLVLVLSVCPFLLRTGASPVPEVSAANGIAIYLADSRHSPGSIVSVDPVTGGMMAIYTRAAGPIASIGMNEYPEKIYFTSGTDGRLYVVRSSMGQWLPEEVYYEHPTVIRDIEQVLRPGLGHDVYISEASGAQANGTIFMVAFDQAYPFYEVELSEVGGHWDGHFTFDYETNLYLGTGDTTPGRLYKVVDGTPQRVARTNQEPIGALTWVRGGEPAGAIYYANLARRLYRVDLTHGYRAALYTGPESAHFSDVDTQGTEPDYATPTPSHTPDGTPSPTKTLPPGVTPSATPSRVVSTLTPTATTSPTTPTLTPTATVGAGETTDFTVAAEHSSGMEIKGLRIAVLAGGQRQILETPIELSLPRGSHVGVTAPARFRRGELQFELQAWRLPDGSTTSVNPLVLQLDQPQVRIVAVYQPVLAGTATATTTPGTAAPETATPSATATATSEITGSVTPTSEPSATATLLDDWWKVYCPVVSKYWSAPGR